MYVKFVQTIFSFSFIYILHSAEIYKTSLKKEKESYCQQVDKVSHGEVEQHCQLCLTKLGSCFFVTQVWLPFAFGWVGHNNYIPKYFVSNSLNDYVAINLTLDCPHSRECQTTRLFRDLTAVNQSAAFLTIFSQKYPWRFYMYRSFRQPLKEKKQRHTKRQFDKT